MNNITDPKINDAPHWISVYVTSARLADKPAVNALLEPIPDAELLRPKLKHTGTAHHWDAAQQIDYWVFSNARNVVCLSIEGFDERQADHSRTLFAERCRHFGHGRIAWIESILREATDSPLTTH